jgi:hypothetical protein
MRARGGAGRPANLMMTKATMKTVREVVVVVVVAAAAAAVVTL